MKSVLSILLIIAMLFSCASCVDGSNDDTSTTASTTEKTNETTTAPVDDNAPKHYEIDLNMDNFETYLNYSSEHKVFGNNVTVSDYRHTIAGVLTFAYYENVVVRFSVTYQFANKTYQGEYLVKLNAAGCAEFCADDDALLAAISCSSFAAGASKSFSIISVTGKVIFTA